MIEKTLHVLIYLWLFIVFGLVFALGAEAGDVTLQWDPSPSDNVDGYIVYYGNDPASLEYSADVGNVTTTKISNLPPGLWYFEATAYNEVQESVRSNQASKEIDPFTPTQQLHVPVEMPAAINIRITVEGTSGVVTN